MTRARIILTAAALCAALAAGPARAQPSTLGTVTAVFADPSDMVIVMDKPGRCGSVFFHIQRAKANFKEVSAVMLTAFTTGKPFLAFVESCAGDRNIMSHGAVTR